jgi:hypothetical protein
MSIVSPNGIAPKTPEFVGNDTYTEGYLEDNEHHTREG